jgi:hypothetical protein
VAPRFSGAAARQDPFGAYPPEPLDGGSRKPHEPSRFRPVLHRSPDGLTGDLRDEEDAKRRYHSLSDRLNEEVEPLEKTAALYDAAKADLAAILKERGVETPEDYREIERLPRERQKLEESVRDAEVRDQEDQRGGALR